MTITSYGYPGTIMTGGPLAAWSAMIGRGYAAKDYASWRVTAVTGGSARTVQAAAGTIAGQGITDVLDVATTVATLDTLSTDGSRYDLIVARRTWQTTNATSMAVVAGTASRAIPARSTTPGTLDDQPLALVKLTRTSGAYTIPEVVDLRVVTSLPGTFVIFDDLALNLITGPGARAFNVSTGFTWERVYDSTGALTWVKRDYSLVDHLVTSSDSATTYTRLTTATAYGKGTQLTVRSNPDGSLPASGDLLYLQASDGTNVGATVFGVDRAGNLTHATVPVALLSDPSISTSIGSSASGWSTNTSSSTTLYTWGPLKQLNLVSRTSNSALTFSAKGGLADTTIFTLTAAYRPKRTVSTTFRYGATDGGQYGGFATIGSDGAVRIISGSPNTTIKTATADAWSVTIDAFYMDF